MPALPLTSVFVALPDPRRDTANKLHALTDILSIATCAVSAFATRDLETVRFAVAEFTAAVRRVYAGPGRKRMCPSRPIQESIHIPVSVRPRRRAIWTRLHLPRRIMAREAC